MPLASHSATQPSPGEQAKPNFTPLTGRAVLVAFNPIAGAGGRAAKVQALVRSLQALGYETTLCQNIEQLVSLAAQATTAGELRGVVAAGGDGTAAFLMNRLPAGTPLATFPLGTENLLARYLGHSSYPNPMAELFRTGGSIDLDAGEANGQLFSLMAGCGFDAEVVARLHRERRGPISHGSYFKPLLRSIRSYPFPLLNVHIEGGETIECRWAFLMNVPRYAFGIGIDPAATPFDGMLNLVTFRRGSLWGSVPDFLAVLTGSHLKREGIEFRSVKEVRIETAGAVNYQLDGDPGGQLPVEIRCVPGRLRMIVDAAFLANQAKIS